MGKLDDEQKSGVNFDLLAKFDFETELQWIAEKRKLIISPLVHAHYDLNSGNTLIRETPDKFGYQVMLVDYEGACMEQRGFDLSTHFNFHLTDANKPRYFSGRNYPNLEYRQNFIKHYLEEWHKMNKINPDLDTIEHIILETDYNSLLHAVFLLSFWIVPNEFTLNNIDMLLTFLKLGQALLRSYFERKEDMITTNMSQY